MRHTQKSLQTDTAVLIESCSICLRRLGTLRFSSHAVSDCRPDWPQVSVPLTKNSTLLAKFILRAGEQRIRHILINQDILCRVPHLCTFSNTLSATASHSSGVHRNERVPKDARNVS